MDSLVPGTEILVATNLEAAQTGHLLAILNCTMNSSATVEDLKAEMPKQTKLAILPLMIAVMAAALVSAAMVAGTAYYLTKTGRLGLPSAPAVAVVPVIVSTHAMVLEPVVVNLADAGGKTFLRLGLTLRIQDAPALKGEKLKEEKPKDSKLSNEADAAVRDVSLEVLGHATADRLLAPEGKEQLKIELKAALARHVPVLKVNEIFFTEFLVQR